MGTLKVMLGKLEAPKNGAAARKIACACETNRLLADGGKQGDGNIGGGKMLDPGENNCIGLRDGDPNGFIV